MHSLLREEVRASQLKSIDDTPLLAQNRDHPNYSQRSRQWMYIGDKSSVIYCEYTEDWKERIRGVFSMVSWAIFKAMAMAASLRSLAKKVVRHVSSATTVPGAHS